MRGSISLHILIVLIMQVNSWDWFLIERITGLISICILMLFASSLI